VRLQNHLNSNNCCSTGTNTPRFKKKEKREKEKKMSLA
jgi:hypothetical protein